MAYFLIQDYQKLHSKCPDCKSDNIEQTTMAIFGSINNEEGYWIEKNQNIAICLCGWTGIVHDLV